MSSLKGGKNVKDINLHVVYDMALHCTQVKLEVTAISKKKKETRT